MDQGATRVPDELSLFDLEDRPGPVGIPVAMISTDQRILIREAFGRLEISDAREQFEVVYELTAQRVRSPTELQARHAQVLISGLADRIRAVGIERSGNSWDDREEDTWIDRL
jgi:DNA polymerase-3 subunit epsilon